MAYYKDIVNVQKTWSVERVERITGEDGGILGYEKTAIEENPYTYMTNEDLTRFWGLYEKIPLKYPATTGQSRKYIQKAWEERGITFEDSRRSLISVFIYNLKERALQVQHAGILIERENDLMFVERLNPTSPYQVSLFKNRKQLKYHLEHRFRQYLILQTIIMENGEQL